MKKYAYDVVVGDVITSLVLDPPGDFVVDHVTSDEENDLVKVAGYIDGNGEEMSFIWGAEKQVTVRDSK